VNKSECTKHAFEYALNVLSWNVAFNALFGVSLVMKAKKERKKKEKEKKNYTFIFFFVFFCFFFFCYIAPICRWG